MKHLKSLAALLLGCASIASATSVVDYHGALATSGPNVVDAKGNQVQLTGMSFFWDVWMSKYYNRSVMDWLVKDWQVSIVRAAMAVDSSNGGYLQDPAASVSRIQTIVDAAIADGIYVLIDWHEENAVNHVAQAQAFFSQMAQKYGDQPNVIFEIYNEPHHKGTDWTWAQIKTYAEAVIPAIRKYSNNLIVVGTPQYSLNVTAASKAPITSASNIAYTLHFYAGTHSDYLSPANAAKTIPLFVTEWGTTISDGGNADTTAFTEESQAWFDNLIDPRKISSCNWSISDKPEGASILVPNASVNGGWNPAKDLTSSGIWVRAMIRKHCTDDPTVCPVVGAPNPPPDTFALPSAILATGYSDQSGVLKESTQESSGGQDLTSLANGDWATYATKSATSTYFVTKARVASVGPGALSLRLDDVEVDSLSVIPTGGAQSWKWTYGTRRFPITTGPHTIKFAFQGAGSSPLYNLQRVEVAACLPETSSVPVALNPLKFYSRAYGMGIAEKSDGSVALIDLRNGANVQYKISSPTATTYAFRAQVASSGNGGSLLVKLGANVKATIPVPGTNGAWVSVTADLALPAGVSSLVLAASGDTGATLFDVANVTIGDPTSVLPHGALQGVGLRRNSTSLTLSIPSGYGFQEAQLVGADGRILSRRSLVGLSEATLPVGAGHQPMWIRLQGANSTTLAVPPAL